jgi:hypothetical protein
VWTNDALLTIGSGAPIGSGVVTIGQGGDLSTAAVAFQDSGVLHLDGGSLTTRAIARQGGGIFQWSSGRLHIAGPTGLSLNVLSALGTSLTLGADQTLQVDGKLTLPFGSSLSSTSALDVGSAEIAGMATLSVSGSTHEFGSGVANSGNLMLTDASVNGPISNAIGGRVTINGDVTFNDLVSGGGFMGAGTAHFLGGLSLSVTPAATSVEGSAALGQSGTLTMIIGGDDAVQEYDQLQVGEELTLDGELKLTLANGFQPQAGDVFELFRAGALSGEFKSFDLPALQNALLWDTSLISSGIISVVSALSADFDGDGDVDGTDLVQWKVGQLQQNDRGDTDADGDTDGSDFLVWQRQLGSDPPPSGVAAAPEPGGLLLAAALLSCVAVSKRVRR